MSDLRKLILAGLVITLGFLFPLRVEALGQAQLTSIFTGRNLTDGTDWTSEVAAGVGDVIRYKVAVVNADGTNTARDVTVRIQLPHLGMKFVLSPVSYVLAANTRAKDADVSTELVDENNYGLEYIPGTSKLTKNGSTRSLSPDSENANLTVSAVDIGDVAAGSGNMAVLEFEAKVVEGQKKVVPTSTPTPTPTGNNTATGSAVATTSPQTGFTDPVWINTLEWIGVGTAGIGLRTWARKIRRKVETK